MNKKNIPTISTDLVDIKQIQTQLGSISGAPPSQKELKSILSLIDLTSLEGKDTPLSIIDLCDKAIKMKTAAICIYPTLVKEAKKRLSNHPVKCASVAGGFPSGQTSLKIKKSEIHFALDQGADEIDFVISRNLMLQHGFNKVFEEIAAAKEICGEKIKLKTILETGELADHNLIYKASEIAINAGSDFIKTSTGKIAINATLESVCIMLNCIREHYIKTKKKIGIKPSGGISNADTAIQYIRLTQNILDSSWICPDLFRFGASRLADSVNQQSSTSEY